MAALHLAGADDAGASQLVDGVRMPTEVRLVEVAALLPYARNSKTHGPRQIEALAARIKELGWTNPLLIADGGILAGHGRLLAAKRLELTRVPAIDCSHLNERQRRELVIWDNRSGEIDSAYDLDMLKLETDDLRALGVDLDAAVGFSEEDLADLFRDMEQPEPEGGGDPDDAPPLPNEPVSVSGDVWVLGPHRVMCGSSLDAADWDKLMAGESADAVWTDPPYNVDIGGKNEALDRANKGNRGKTGGILNDKMSSKAFYDFLLSMYQCVLDVMEPGAPIYVAHAETESVNFRKSFVDAGFKMQSVLIWAKNIHVLGRWDFQPKHEPIIYGWKPGAAHKWYGGRKNTTVIDLGAASPFTRMEDGRYQIRVGDSVLVVSADAMVEEHPTSIICEPKPAKSGLHPTQKPVALVERMLRNSARPGDIVVDAFGGSGTTLVAADRLGMRARLMELDPRFCDVIIRRFEMLTGLRAVHAVTGQTFSRDGEARAPAPLPAPALDDDDSLF